MSRGCSNLPNTHLNYHRITRVVAFWIAIKIHRRMFWQGWRKITGWKTRTGNSRSLWPKPKSMSYSTPHIACRRPTTSRCTSFRIQRPPDPPDKQDIRGVCHNPTFQKQIHDVQIFHDGKGGKYGVSDVYGVGLSMWVLMFFWKFEYYILF